MSEGKAAGSDIRMMIATQAAYLDGEKGMTVGQLIFRTLWRCGGSRVSLSKRQRAQLETASYIRERISQDELLWECSHWIIRETADDNARTGFYGCLIDTCGGEAVLGFRGSESFDMNQKILDWVMADFGLLNSMETAQQQRARKFVRHVYDRYGGCFKHYNFTGHSLGGNLAEHAAVTAPDGMPVRRCVNLDGPGFSGEYIASHETQIRRNGRYVDHYQYSAAGALLFPLPGTNYQTVRAHNDREHTGLRSCFWRHHTRNIEFDANGNVQTGDPDLLSMLLGPASRAADQGFLRYSGPAVSYSIFV